MLSCSQFSPLQIELAFLYTSYDSWQSSSFRHHSQAATNRIKAIHLILDRQVLTRHTLLSLDIWYPPLNSNSVLMTLEHMPLLSLLSTIHIHMISSKDYGIPLIHSLIKLSPSPRHIRGGIHNLGPQDLGVEVWAKRIESYDWIFYR